MLNIKTINLKNKEKINQVLNELNKLRLSLYFWTNQAQTLNFGLFANLTWAIFFSWVKLEFQVINLTRLVYIPKSYQDSKVVIIIYCPFPFCGMWNSFTFQTLCHSSLAKFNVKCKGWCTAWKDIFDHMPSL